MDDQVLRRELEKWLVRSISLNDELQSKQQQLRDALHQSQRSHLMDLLKYSTGKVAKAEAEVSRVSEQKRTIQKQLWSTAVELEACYQELQHTNQELCAALSSTRLTCEQATQRAKNLLKQETPAREALATLLGDIYGSTIKPWELQKAAGYLTSHVDGLAAVLDESLPLSEEAARFKAHYLQLAAQFASLKARLTRLQAQYQQ